MPRARSVVTAAVLACLGARALPAQDAPRTLEFTGLVLVNGFSNSNTVNNSDVPQFVVPDTAARRGGLCASCHAAGRKSAASAYRKAELLQAADPPAQQFSPRGAAAVSADG